jgi:hypothetical protein
MALRQGLDREHTKRMWQDALAQRCDGVLLVALALGHHRPRHPGEQFKRGVLSILVSNLEHARS